MASLCLFLLAILMLAPEVACADSGSGHMTALDILRRAIAAEHTTNVRGKELAFIEPPGLPAVTMEREVIRTKTGSALYRWSAPTAQRGTITLDDGQWTKCYLPSTREITTTRSSPQSRDSRSVARLVRLISRNYAIRLTGKEQVSGRRCYVVTLTPRSDAVHAMKLWIDNRTFYAISRQENNARGHTISLTLFRWVEFPRDSSKPSIASPFPAAARMVKSPLARVFNNIADLRRTAQVEVCVPVSMPGGFEFERCELVDVAGRPTLCLRFTDGWSSISIYQSRAAGEQRPPTLRAMHYSRHTMGDCAIECATSEMNFMLIGRVEMNGLVCIANALDPDRERTYLADTAKAYRVPMSALAAMRSKGLGIDTINALLEISARSRRPVTSLVSFVRDGYCWRDLARQLRVDSRRFAARIRFFECR